jgi:aspartyl-tRNA(Asn)/glutamyl-tRNA(Gln) amidotransferase subunit C
MIEEKDIKKLAELARIELSDQEISGFKNEFEQILEYVSHLDVAGTASGDIVAGEHRNIFREDNTPHESGVYTKALIAAAPTSEGDSVTIGKVIKGAQ